MQDLHGTPNQIAPFVSTEAIQGRNLLLATLSATQRRSVVARCESVQLSVGDVLCEQGERLSHVYFPIDSVVSLISSIDERSKLEVELVGAEGMLGGFLMLGMNVASARGLVQVSGVSLRLDARQFCRVLEQSPALERTLKRYLCVVVSQVTQRAACAYFYRIEGRLARWLLMIQDRTRSAEFYMTHEIAAYTLGVRRVGITCAAAALQREKLIRYSRGRVAILDRAGLGAAACQCYAAANYTYSHIMRGLAS